VPVGASVAGVDAGVRAMSAARRCPAQGRGDGGLRSAAVSGVTVSQ